MANRTKVRWWQRFQLEVGFGWKLFPSGLLTWRTWAWDPFFNLVWPGKQPVCRADLPDGEVFGGLEQVPGSDPKEFRNQAMIWWLGMGIRVLGLDMGVGMFWRPARSVAKLEGRLKEGQEGRGQ
jgi:hypothetical protein